MIVRSPRPENHFTILNNALLRDSRLTFKARGLLALLLSFPDNWRASSEHLARLGPDGRDAIRTAMKELEAAGYLIRKKRQNPQSGLWSTETYIYDFPQIPWDNPVNNPQPTTDNPTSDSPSPKEETKKKDGRRKSLETYVTRERSICGLCSGAGWRPLENDLEKCSCDGGVKR